MWNRIWGTCLTAPIGNAPREAARQGIPATVT
jgi:hypothetical protein